MSDELSKEEIEIFLEYCKGKMISTRDDTSHAFTLVAMHLESLIK